MTASPRREVDRNPLRGGALGSAQARPGPDDAGGQDFGDLVEALGRGHEVGVEGVGHVRIGVVADRRWPDGGPGETSEPFHAPIQRAVATGLTVSPTAPERGDTLATPSSMDVPIRPLPG
jgi:hypothetical protein